MKYTLIYPYYENPTMLEKQVEEWNSYSPTVKNNIEIILIDDCSPTYPAKEIFEKYTGKKRLYRVSVNIPWGQHHARNIGAKEADTKWLYMSDCDIIVPKDMAEYLFNPMEPNSKNYYMFERKYAPDFSKSKVHPNTFLVTRENFWKTGGYHYRFVGTYGGDGALMKELDKVCPKVQLSSIILHGYERDVIKDANTNLGRKDSEYGKEYKKRVEQFKKEGSPKETNPIREAYERIF